MLACTIFVQLQSLVVISTHADRQRVDMSITVCLFVCLFVNLSLCTVTDFSAGDKASGVKFCTMVHGRPGHGISHFGEHCSSRSPKSDESAPVLKICSFQKKAPYLRGGCPDTLDTLVYPPLKSMILHHNVHSKYSIIALLVLITMFLTSWNLIITLI